MASFTNIYYKRATATPKACYVCCKPTTTVLATVNTTDFIYTCDSHLKESAFATLLGDTDDGVGGGASKKMGLSAEEIQKVKEAWEEKQRKKEKAKEKEKETEKDGKDKSDAVKDGSGSGKDADKNSKTPAPIATPAPAAPAQPKHQRYTLHRDFFAMRLALHRKRRQTAQAKELAPRLPGPPRGAPTDGP